VADRWFLSRDNRELGPFDLDQLRQMAAEGRLSREETIRTEVGSRVQRAGEVPELFAEPGLPQLPATVTSVKSEPSLDVPARSCNL
jgi:hypothetical protein